MARSLFICRFKLHPSDSPHFLILQGVAYGMTHLEGSISVQVVVQTFCLQVETFISTEDKEEYDGPLSPSHMRNIIWPLPR